MKRILPVLLLAILVLPSGFCATSLLRVQRAGSPAGPWEEVAADTLPITAEGALQDTYESAAGYYRLRIEPSGEWGIPLTLPLDDVPPRPKELAKSLINDLQDVGGDNAWEDAVLGPVAFPVYSPVGGEMQPTYMEFVVLGPQPEPPDMPWGSLAAPAPSLSFCPERSRGFIMVSLSEDDLPIVEYSTEGSTLTECLRKQANSSAVRIVRYDDSFLAAENEKGDLVSYIGPPPVYYPPAIMDYCDQEFEGYLDEQGEKNPDPPPFEGEPYKSYEDFKKDYLEAERFKESRRRRAEDATLEWEIINGQHEEVINLVVCVETTIFQGRTVVEFVLGDDSFVTYKILNEGVLIHALKPGITTLHVAFSDQEVADGFVVASEKALSPDQPTGWTSWSSYYAGSWSDQRRYTQEPGGSCVSGCGATAWAMLYGWFDYTGAASNLIAGSAPLYNNDPVRDCIWYVVDRIGTYCVGSQGATNPWNMYKGYRWAQHRGHGWYVSYTWSVPCFYSSSARNKARDSIKNDHRPTIIGIGCTSSHYPVAYGYKSRRYRVWGVTWYTQRRFKCNMGWGGSSPQWKNAKVWYGQRNNFW